MDKAFMTDASDSPRQCARCGAPLKRWASGSVCWRCMMEVDSSFSLGDGLLAEPSPASLQVVTEPSLRFGDYVLEREIAHGGMGVVYRARQVSLDRIVAVKLLLLGRYSSAESIERFRRETQSVAALRHPNIVAIHEVGECDGQHFFSMEYVEGRNLTELLREGPLPPHRAAEHARTIAEAMHYAHSQGVLHRDLKPSNVLIDVLGQVRITDFGLAKKLDGSSDLTVTGQMVGTPNYLSPEAAAGRHAEVGPASDVYAIGALLYELLTGRPPFLAQSLQETLLRIRDTEPVAPRALNPGVPLDLETICLRCLEKEPARRYASAQALAEDLQHWLRHEPILARPAGALERAGKWARRQPLLAGMLLATVLAVIAVLATLTVAYLRVRAAQEQTVAKAEESRQRLLRLNVFSGNKLVEEGDFHGALLWFVEAMRLEQDAAREDVHRRRFAAVLRGAPALGQIWFHDSFVSAVNFSGDGARVVSASLDHTARVWDALTGVPATPPLRPGMDVMGARFTPDGKRVVTIDAHRALHFWNAFTGETQGVAVATAAGDANAIAFSPDGQWLAVPVTNGVRLLNVATGAVLGLTLSCTSAVQLVRFSPDGARIAAIGPHRALELWNFPSGRPAAKPLAHSNTLRNFAFSHAGRRVATITLRELSVWDLDTGELAWQPIQPGGDLFDCRFSPDDRWLATASWNGKARVFDAQNGLPVGDSMRHRAGVGQSLFSPNGQWLATVSWDGTARLWEPQTGQPESPSLHHASYVTVADFSPDGTRLVTAGQDKTVRLWELRTNSPARLTLRHRGAVTRGQFSPDGSHILTCGSDQQTRLWNAGSGELLMSLRHKQGLTDGSFSADGKWIVTACRGGSAHVWDPTRGEEIIPAVLHAKILRHAEFSADGERFVTASDDGTARVWSTKTGQPITPALQHSRPVWHATFSPNGRRVVTASFDRTAQVWDAQTGERIGSPLKHICEVFHAAFSPDGRRVVTACSDRSQLARSAYVWDATTGQPSGRPLPHLDGVFYAEFSPSGRFIATSGEDKSAIIWDAASGERLIPPLRHGSYVLRVVFSPDSRLVLTVSSDNIARVWESATGEPITPPLPHAGSVTFGSWSPDGREVITASDDGTARVWDVSPSQAMLAELKRQAELLSAHRLQGNVGMTPLSTAEVKERWQAR